MAALAGVESLLAVSSSAIFSLARKRCHKSAAWGQVSASVITAVFNQRVLPEAERF
jgi:hypothetical protein